ncbi:MAG: hypothetical protein IKN73_04660 [Alphaproteobacteria bacterium]|nr:hypothetical protein [Alphaproteobacteria bacterium]
MKKILLLTLPAILLCACEKVQQYTLNTDAFCVGIEEDSMESVFCKDTAGNPVNGIVVQYFEDGKVAREITVRNGQEYGLEKEYYQNGNLKVSANIKNGQPVGISKLYHENGNIHMIIKWHDNEADIQKIYDESGKLISEK